MNKYFQGAHSSIIKLSYGPSQLLNQDWSSKAPLISFLFLAAELAATLGAVGVADQVLGGDTSQAVTAYGTQLFGAARGNTLALLAVDVAEVLLQAGVGDAAGARGHGAVGVGLAAGEVGGLVLHEGGGAGEAGQGDDDGGESELHFEVGWGGLVFLLDDYKKLLVGWYCGIERGRPWKD
ncbi:hypothetical protein PG990_001750 [Apiospora arundinis]